MCSKTTDAAQKGACSPKEKAIFDGVLRLMEGGADLRLIKVQQIAEAAGIGKGTVYEYFASKEEILQGMAAYCVETETENLAAALAPCQTLEALLDALLAYLRDVLHTRAAAYRILTRTMAREEQSAMRCEGVNPLLQLFVQTVTRLQAAGEIDAEAETGFCVFAITSACAGCLTACNPGMAGHEDEILRNARRLMQRALQK